MATERAVPPVEASVITRLFNQERTRIGGHRDVGFRSKAVLI